jgi:phage shock protein C
MELLRTRLRRSSHDEVFLGVIGGVAEFFGVNSGRARIAYVLASIFSAGFPGIIAYFLLWYVMPDDLGRS